MLSGLYLRRWTIENGFQTMTEVLALRGRYLAYPKAALLGFCVALVGYNILAAVRAALRSEHGAEAVDEGVSSYHVMCEVRETYRGMIIALPPEELGAVAGLEHGRVRGVAPGGSEPGEPEEVPADASQAKPDGKRSRSRRNKKGKNHATARLLNQRMAKQ